MAAQRPKSFKTDLPSFSRSHLVGCAPCSFWWSVLGLSSPSSSKGTSPPLLLLICLPVLLALSGGPFWPLSSPNPSKRTSPALLLPIWLAVLIALSPGPFLAAAQLKFFKADLTSCSRSHLVACAPCIPLSGVRPGRGGEIRFEGFGPLSGQNGPPERERAVVQCLGARGYMNVIAPPPPHPTPIVNHDEGAALV